MSYPAWPLPVLGMLDIDHLMAFLCICGKSLLLWFDLGTVLFLKSPQI